MDIIKRLVHLCPSVEADGMRKALSDYASRKEAANAYVDNLVTWYMMYAYTESWCMEIRISKGIDAATIDKLAEMGYGNITTDNLSDYDLGIRIGTNKLHISRLQRLERIIARYGTYCIYSTQQFKNEFLE